MQIREKYLETALTSALFWADGRNTMTADLDMDGNDLVGLPSTPAATGAASKEYVDNLVTGITWRAPIDALNYYGEDSYTNVEALSPTAGDAYVLTSAGTLTLGSLAVVAGDVVEYDGAAWVKVVAGVGGFVADGVRLAVNVASGFVGSRSGSDIGKIFEFDGTDLAGTDSGDAVDGNAILVNSDGSYFENQCYVFNGTVPAAGWTQFSGAGQINAGLGLTKTGNTINVGDAGRGVQVNADTLEIDASEIAGNGLQENGTSSWLLEVKLDTTTGGGVSGLSVGANGLLISSAAAGNGLQGGAGSALSIKPNTTDGGGVAGLETAANGVRIATSAAGNGLIGGGGVALAVRPNTTDGSGVAGLEAAANGVRIATTAAGNGLTGGGGAALAVQANGDSVSVGASGIKAAVFYYQATAASSVTTGSGDSTGITLATTPAGDCDVKVFVGPLGAFRLGSGVKTSDFYFSSDGGTTAKTRANWASGDTLYQGDALPFNLDTSDFLTLEYDAII